MSCPLRRLSGPAARWPAPALRAVVLAVVLAAGPGAPGGVAGEARAEPAPATCPQDTAVVRGASATDLEDICAGVAASLAFLASYGVHPTEPVSIEVAPKLPDEAGPTAAGCYLEARRRIVMQPYSRFVAARTRFGVPIDRALYRALAAHETAHAVSACHFKMPHPTIQAKEYIAYVAMFSTMTPTLRARALRGVKTEGFASLDRFTPLLYSFDPMRFGAEAWRHFSAAPDPGGLLRSILAGEVLRD